MCGMYLSKKSDENEQLTIRIYLISNMLTIMLRRFYIAEKDFSKLSKLKFRENLGIWEVSR